MGQSEIGRRDNKSLKSKRNFPYLNKTTFDFQFKSCQFTRQTQGQEDKGPEREGDTTGAKKQIPYEIYFY